MMMTKRERKRESLVAHKNVDKMEAFGCLTFSPKKQLSLKQRVGYSVVAFLFPPRTIRRTRRDTTRAFRRPFLVGLRNTTRIISFAQTEGQSRSKHTHTPTSLSD
jgi:hypothetical protein